MVFDMVTVSVPVLLRKLYGVRDFLVLHMSKHGGFVQVTINVIERVWLDFYLKSHHEEYKRTRCDG